MASPNLYSNGVGGASGAALASLKPLYCSGSVYYLDSQTGDDTYTGLERNKPFATLATAIAAMSAYDALVVLAGSTETITVAVADGGRLDGITIIGEGTGSQRPKFTCGADIAMLTLVGANIMVDNLYFAASTVDRTSDGVLVASGDGFWMNNCYFEAGGHDHTQSAYLDSGHTARVTNTTFASTSTDVDDQPYCGLAVDGATALTLDTVVFDGGTSGWSRPYALVTGIVTVLRATNIDLLNDSDVKILTKSYGYFHVRNKSGSARVVWAA